MAFSIFTSIKLPRNSDGRGGECTMRKKPAVKGSPQAIQAYVCLEERS